MYRCAKTMYLFSAAGRGNAKKKKKKKKREKNSAGRVHRAASGRGRLATAGGAVGVIVGEFAAY